MLNWYQIVLVLGVLQGFALMAIMYSSGRHTKAGMWYTWLLFCNSITLLGEVLYQSEVISHLPWLIVVFDLSLFLYGPLIYLFIQFLFAVKPKHLFLHFLPFIGFELTLNPLIELNAHGLVTTFSQEIMGYFWLMAEGLGIVSLSAYLIASWRFITKRNGDKAKQVLVQSILRWTSVGMLIWVTTYALKFTPYDFIGGYKGYSYTWLYLVINSYVFGYFIVNERKRLLVGHVEKKYKGITRSKTEIDLIISGLDALMTKEKLYLNKDLSLHDLARRLNQRPNVVSMVLNKELKMSFFTYVNQFRVAAFIERANSPSSQNLTIEGLAKSSGFQSKSAFHSAFRKAYGKKKPSDFIGAAGRTG